MQRFIITEVGKSAKIEVLSNRYISTLFAILPALVLTLGNIVDPISGQKIKLGWALWPIFGASNQMLASLILMMLSIYFWKKKKPIFPLFIPFVFITTTAFASLLFNAKLFIQNNNFFLFSLDIVLIFFIIWMLYEGFKTYKTFD